MIGTASPFPCSDDEIAVKSFFLGPCAENSEWLQRRLVDVLHHWFENRRTISEVDGSVIPRSDRSNDAFVKKQLFMETILRELTERFSRELPKFSPRYMGHMFSELSMPALLGHWVALLQNPNNISKEASHVGLEIEREAVQMLLKMFGFDPRIAIGHFTSGGTVANFEAVLRARARQRLWIALGAFVRRDGSRISLFDAAHMGWSVFDQLFSTLESRDEFLATCDTLIHSETFIQQMETVYEEKWKTPALVVSAGAHYSWMKAADFFGTSREAVFQIPCDAHGQLDVGELERTLARLQTDRRPTMMTVTLAGSTELGTVDPIGEVSEILRRTSSGQILHHVDAAFGGFFACAREGAMLSGRVCSSLRSIDRVDSVTVDPHKMGYVPYSSGVFLCANKRNYPHHRVDAPYIDFDHDLDPGLQTIEGSRAATGATATWLTGQSIGFDKNGYGRILDRTIAAKQLMEQKLKAAFGQEILIPEGLDLNIVCFAFRSGSLLSETNKISHHIFAMSGTPALSNFCLSKTAIKLDSNRQHLRDWIDSKELVIDEDRIVFVRSCLMNPFLLSKEPRVDFLSEFILALSREIADFRAAVVRGGT